MSNIVQKLREQQNLTQNELAEKSGLSLRTIQRIEAGNIPKGYTLRSLANALQISPDQIILAKDQNQVDISRAKLINISASLFLLIPFTNIIIPAFLTYKTKDPHTRKLGKDILGIQIIWTALTSILMIICPFIQKAFSMQFPLFLPVLIALIAVDLLIIFKNGMSLNQKGEIYIKLKNNIL
ncbi:helix-turn-helix domain-containing protein [Chryseobacterium paridis]|uniref:Helix-turn-helix domain-containing protein n=1 Tax=Chryseobacterium paridis TaxID=2800328 RepID=A0ABS1FSJ0_9FLAO|nr:helix-turn-helix domain-containing protein [Chryseobacterium paridis]MBK1895380.1 helix-turn-helix domain-containing protein [Chryseobacterium paridis]